MLPESRLQTKLLILLQFLTAARHSSVSQHSTTAQHPARQFM